MFVFCWSLISPLCLGIVAGSLSLAQQHWSIADSNIGLSIVVYASYWLLLAMLQGAALFWRFQDRKFAIRWVQTTAIIGSFAMIAHDLFLVLRPGGPPGGQGIVILLITLPCLAVLGSLLLGTAQFRIVRSHYRDPTTANNRNPLWFVVSFMSWIIGFGGIFISLDNISIMPLFITIGTALKGWFIDKYLA
jgi:hypothetical protein